MSNCTIKGCANAAVAKGLCAMHYMRQRRRGDPEAAFKPGRQPKPHREDSATTRVKHENAALREEVATLKRRLEEAQVRPAAAPSAPPAPGEGTGMLWESLRRLTTENSALKKQLADARAANPGVGPAEEKAAGRLAREVDQLKETLAKAEAKLAEDPGEVGKLERQLKAAKTRIRTLQAQAKHAWEAAKAKGLAMDRRDRLTIVKCLHDDQLHPDIKKILKQHPVLAKQYLTACQTFNALFDKKKLYEKDEA